jgi:hypothetical protein
LDGPLAAVAWTGTMHAMVNRLKISTSIPCAATQDNTYAVISRGKQIPPK